MTEPWGTPLRQGASSERTPYDRFDRHDLVRFSTAPLMSEDFRLAVCLPNSLSSGNGSSWRRSISVSPKNQTYPQSPDAGLPRRTRRARWSTTNFDWNSFTHAVEEAIELFSPAPMSLRDRVHRLALPFSQRQSSTWESLKQVDTPSPG